MSLVQSNGPIHFLCGGWECQPMSMAGLHKGLEDDRFLPFLDMVKILNFLQAEQHPSPLFLFENTWPGMPGQYPNIDKASEMIEAFLGAPVVIDAAGLGSAAHRVRLFWTNWCRPEILQEAMPKDIRPTPSLKQILHDFHVPTKPSHNPRHPFAQHNKVGKQRICLPTIVSFPKSHAFREQANGKPGQGQLWNKLEKCWEEPSLEEKEQLMGYKVGATMGGLATRQQRLTRLGQAMDGNTMRWLGAFLYATYTKNMFEPDPEGIHLKGGFSIHKNRLEKYFKPNSDREQLVDDVDHHHQACAVVQQLLRAEPKIPVKELGGGDMPNQKRQKLIPKVFAKGETSGTTPDKFQPAILKNKWKIGGGLEERDQLDVLKVLSENNDRFAYTIEELSRYTGPAMEINLNSQKDIFRPPHKLGEKELAFVGEQCEKTPKTWIHSKIGSIALCICNGGCEKER